MIFAVLVGSLVIPALLLLLLRTNTAVVFFSLCAGSVLVNYGGHTVLTAADSFSANSSPNLDVGLQIGLLLLPAVVSAVLLRKSFSTTKIIIFALPALAVSLTGLLLVVPLLPGGVQHTITSSEIWKPVDNYRDFIILTSFLVSLAVLWVSKPKKEKSKHK